MSLSLAPLLLFLLPSLSLPYSPCYLCLLCFIFLSRFFPFFLPPLVSHSQFASPLSLSLSLLSHPPPPPPPPPPHPPRSLSCLVSRMCSHLGYFFPSSLTSYLHHPSSSSSSTSCSLPLTSLSLQTPSSPSPPLLSFLLYRSTSTELSITIDNVQLSDEGDYTCSIFTMPVRTARATVTVLGVPGKPQISGNEEAVQEGGEVTLTCTSTGSKPPAKLRWYQGDRELEGEAQGVCSDPGSLTYTVRSQVTLTVSRSDDNALITCAVDHESLASGDVKSSQALRVLCETSNVQVKSLAPSNTFSLSFSLSPVRPTSYEWLKTDGELPPLAKVDGAFLRFEMLNKSDNGVYLCNADNGIGQSQGEYKLLVQDPTAMSTSSGVDHAVIGGVVAVIVFILLCLLIVLGRYLIRHKGTYLTHEAKGSDDAPDADTAIINAEGGHSGAEDKKEYFI
uniref:Cell adhesion molecule 3 n=1 Tax=Myripristis murdjan TaxID=586833 RepID=A0A667Z0S0_9TELE